MHLSAFDRLRLRLQRGVAIAFAPFTYLGLAAWLRYGRRYRIERLGETRREFRALLNRTRGRPLLICANHLTLIDSLLLVWAIAPWYRCTFSPRAFPWNLPERKNFWKGVGLRLLCYFGKCVAVVREGGNEKAQRTMNQIGFLLGRGDSIMVFPEGGRSRTGRIDVENFSYGPGQILVKHPSAEVVCLYLRGEKQAAYSDLPERDQRFRVLIKSIRPETASVGLRASRDLSTQIVHALAGLEREFFT